MILRLVFSLALVALLKTASVAQNWSSCQSEVDRVRGAAEVASDAAQRVASNARDVESKRFDLELCISNPRIYDFWNDRCQSLREEYKSAIRAFSSKKSDLQNELNTVESQLWSAQLYCGYNPALGASTIRRQPPQRQSGLCNILQSYKGTTAPAALLSICLKSMTEDECGKCLQVNTPAQTPQPTQDNRPQIATKTTEKAGDKSFVSLVQFDGPRVKFGITLSAELVGDGSGSGTGKVIYPGNSQLLDGKYHPLSPAGTGELKILEKDTFKKVGLREDVPSTIAVFSGGDTIMECVYGQVKGLNQKKGACKDNQGNRYHMVFE